MRAAAHPETVTEMRRRREIQSRSVLLSLVEIRVSPATLHHFDVDEILGGHRRGVWSLTPVIDISQ